MAQPLSIASVGLVSSALVPFPMSRVRTAVGVGVAMAGILAGGVEAQNPPHLSIIQPGGMPGLPVVTGIERATNGVRVTWDGPAGYYRLWQKLTATSTQWQAVGGLNLTRQAVVPLGASNAFFRVSGPAPRYAGAQACAECHEAIYRQEAETAHTHALATLQSIGQHRNAVCLPCHTVGHGLPTGFVNETLTPHLGGVQCENCHGPAANHAANELDIASRPRSELAAQVCGGCHTGSHQPTWEEYQTSGHARVTEDMNPASRINACGRCHSGSARLALLKGLNPAVAVTNDANVAITCVVCHDPHGRHVWTNVLTGAVTTNQLRNPVASTNDYWLSTSDGFATKYAPAINICAQCHNHRGAAWTNSGRPPHYSPQYNMLLGTVGELADGPAAGRSATHAVALDQQCVTCHMPTEEHQSEAHPAVTGHAFRADSFESCRACHVFPELSTPFVQMVVQTRVQQVKAALDLWATTRAPEPLRVKYGPRAWEYTTPGSLSPGGTGPTASEQGLIPDPIKKARFNLYLVKHDGSYGVHNPRHTIRLLEQAQAWIQLELER